MRTGLLPITVGTAEVAVAEDQHPSLGAVRFTQGWHLAGCGLEPGPGEDRNRAVDAMSAWTRKLLVRHETGRDVTDMDKSRTTRHECAPVLVRGTQ